jgi:type II secretory pathway component PulJ
MKRMFKKGRSYTLVEILIAAAIFALVVRLLYGVYTKVIVGTGSEQNRLIRLVSHARLASRVINWELTNAHELVTPENKDDVSRTAHTLVYFDSSDCLSLIELENGNLVKKNMLTGKIKTLVKDVDEVYFTRLDENLVQFRIKIKAKQVTPQMKYKEFQVVSSVFVAFGK